MQSEEKGGQSECRELVAVTILLGKLEVWKSFWNHWKGVGKAEHEESRRRGGITREVIYLHHTPEGDKAVVYVESVLEHPEMVKALQTESPFNDAFRKMIKEVHGFDQMAAVPLSEPMFDWRG